MFHEPAPATRSFPTTAVVIAAITVVVVVAVLALMNRHRGESAASAGTLQPLAAYAPQLQFGDIQLSESTSFSGGKETFVDGRVTNKGQATVTGITAQVLFASDGGGGAQMETVPVALVRSREPYVDTQPVSAAPLAPGASADFRLTFDDVRPEWNQQAPEIHVIQVTTR
jgi:hypothetical protein